MTIEKIFEIIASILAGMAVCIPLARKLVAAVTAAVKSRNWLHLVVQIATLMESASELELPGASKKEWVLKAAKESSDYVDMDMDDAQWDKVDVMIDILCDMANKLAEEKAKRKTAVELVERAEE